MNRIYCRTVKTPELVAVPPFVVILIVPVLAPVGTVAVTCVSEFTTNVAAFPPKATFVVWVKLCPVIVTEVATLPLLGLKLRMTGVTRNEMLLVRIPPGVLTVTDPVFAPAGTAAVR